MIDLFAKTKDIVRCDPDAANAVLWLKGAGGTKPDYATYEALVQIAHANATERERLRDRHPALVAAWVLGQEADGVDLLRIKVAGDAR